MSLRAVGLGIRIGVVAVLLVGALTCTSWAQDDAAADAVKGQGKGGGDMVGMITKRMWWNQDKMVEDLKLAQNQREKLDQKFVESSAVERGSRRKLSDLRRKYEQALRGGNWTGAKATAEELAEAQKGVMKEQLVSRADMLAVLTEDQRTKLLSTHGRLLVSNWLGHGGVGPRGRGAGGGPGGGGGRHRGQGGGKQHKDDGGEAEE